MIRYVISTYLCRLLFCSSLEPISYVLIGHFLVNGPIVIYPLEANMLTTQGFRKMFEFYELFAKDIEELIVSGAATIPFTIENETLTFAHLLYDAGCMVGIVRRPGHDDGVSTLYGGHKGIFIHNTRIAGGEVMSTSIVIRPIFFLG